MSRVIGGLLFSALLAGTASGLYLFGITGVFITLPLAFATALLLGLPAYLLLRKLNWLAWWQLAIAGAALTSPMAFGIWPTPYVVIATLGTGAAAGVIFWWAAIALGDSSNRTG